MPGTDLPAELGWFVGHWEREVSSETWVDAGSAIIGIGMGVRGPETAFYEVMIIDHVDGVVTFTALPNGQRAVDFRLARLDEQRAAFANPAHDYPRWIEYTRAGDVLTTRTRGRGPDSDLAWQSRPARSSDALEAIDRAFAADSAARGAQAWVVAFAPSATMWTRKSGLIDGNHAIGAVMERALAGGENQLLWEPTASGLSSLGDLGFTTGRYRMVRAPASARPDVLDQGSYITIWRRQHNGRWLAVHDVGVPD